MQPKKRRLKLKKRYRKPIDKLQTQDIVLIHDFNTYASIKRTISAMEKGLVNMCPVAHNTFGLSHRGRRPRFIEENDEFVFYEI